MEWRPNGGHEGVTTRSTLFEVEMIAMFVGRTPGQGPSDARLGIQPKGAQRDEASKMLIQAATNDPQLAQEKNVPQNDCIVM
jgi:hypothetical protein